VQLHELTADAQIRALRAGRLDFGIGLGPLNETDLIFESICREALVLAIPADHSLARASGPVRLKEVASEAFVVPPRELAPGLYDEILGLCRSNGFAPQITQHTYQMQTECTVSSTGPSEDGGSMRLREFMSFELPAAQADVVVLAEDILPEHYSLPWARETFPDTPIVYVAGNYELYDAYYEMVLARCRQEAGELGIHFLERDAVVIDGVRFLGTTLWADFKVELGSAVPAAFAMAHGEPVHERLSADPLSRGTPARGDDTGVSLRDAALARRGAHVPSTARRWSSRITCRTGRVSIRSFTVIS